MLVRLQQKYLMVCILAIGCIYKSLKLLQENYVIFHLNSLINILDLFDINLSAVSELSCIVWPDGFTNILFFHLNMWKNLT